MSGCAERDFIYEYMYCTWNIYLVVYTIRNKKTNYFLNSPHMAAIHYSGPISTILTNKQLLGEKRMCEEFRIAFYSAVDF